MNFWDWLNVRINKSGKAVLIAIAILVLAGCGFIFFGAEFLRQKFDIDISFSETRIDNTPQVMEIKSISEWEFLAVYREVIVDTVREREFWTTDDRLVRIYRGCLSLGVNLKDADDNWITVTGSTVNVNLPKIRLLDERFIDEANSVSFYESGKWSGEAREKLFAKAEEKMLKYALAPEMLDRARQQAETRFKSLFSAIGYPNVKVTFAD